jgi:hypothetical protein
LAIQSTKESRGIGERGYEVKEMIIGVGIEEFSGMDGMGVGVPGTSVRSIL